MNGTIGKSMMIGQFQINFFEVFCIDISDDVMMFNTQKYLYVID